MGQAKFLYLTSDAEDARWFANEKGCDTVVIVHEVPLSFLRVDPEDGVADTVAEELNSPFGLPGKVVLVTSLDANHFSVLDA